MAKKAREAFRTISEVADWLDVPAHVLRFWESKFQQIKPVKRAGGRRYYRPNDMLLIGGIKALLHDDGLTIRGVQKILKEEGVKHVASFSQDIDAPADADAAQTRADERARRKQMGEDIRRRKPGITPQNRDEIEDAELAEDPPAPDAPPEPSAAPAPDESEAQTPDLFGGDNVVPIAAEPAKEPDPAPDPAPQEEPEERPSLASVTYDIPLTTRSTPRARPKGPIQTEPPEAPQTKEIPADPDDAEITLTEAQRRRLETIAALRAVPREEHMLEDADLLGPRRRLIELRNRLAAALS